MAVGIEVLLNRIKLLENAESGDFQAATLVHFSLIWPNLDKPVVQTVKALKLQNGLEIDFVNGHNPDTRKPYTYSDRAIFKETLIGRSELVVNVVTVEQTPRLERILAAVFGAALGIAFNLAVGGISNLVLGAVLQNIGDRYGKSAGVRTSDRLTPVGDALLHLDEKSLPHGPQSLTLFAPQDVTISKLVLDTEDDRAHHVTEQVLHKNKPNGFVELEVNLL